MNQAENPILAEKKKMLLVFNPKAGLESMRMNVFEVVSLLSEQNFLVTLYPTRAKFDAYHIICSYAKEYDYVVCSGGDGTLNESIDAIMTLVTPPIFGYIPSGTTNDFATTTGIPTDVLQATRVLFTGEPSLIDIGVFQEEFFSYIAAFGLFTDVSYGTAQGLKNMFGHAAYLLEGVKRLGNIRSWHCKIDADGELIEDDFILGMVTNSASIGGFTLPDSVHHGHSVAEREFTLILLRKVTSIFDLQAVISVLLGGKDPNGFFIIKPVSEVTVYTEEPLDWSLDGEYGGSFTESRISIRRNALHIITPK